MPRVYGIRAQDSDQYFYVGCTKKPARDRLREHLDNVRYKSHVNRHFANKVKKLGYRVAVDVLEETEDGQQFKREQWWIEHFLEQGAKLTNIIHNGVDPSRFRSVSKYSLSNNWEWVQGWYKDFKRGYALRAERPESDELVLLAQRKLAEIVEQVLSVPPQERQALIAQFDSANS